MATSGIRGAAATIVGWAIALIVLFLLFGAVFATIRILFRLAVFVVVIGVLLWVYFKLRGGDD